MRNADLDFALSGLNDLADNRMRSKHAVGVYRLRKKLTEAMVPVGEARDALIKRLGDGGQIQPTSPNWAAFVEEFNELMEDDTEFVSDFRINLSEIDVELKPSSVAALENCGLLEDA